MNRIVTQQPTLDTSAYAAGDACGGLLTFNLGRDGTDKTVLLRKAELLDDAATPDEAEVVLHLFTESSVAGTDQAAFSVSQDEYLAGYYLGSITFTTYAATVVGDNSGAKICIQDDLNMLIPLNGGKVYGQLSCTGTPTFAADQLIVALHFGEYA